MVTILLVEIDSPVFLFLAGRCSMIYSSRTVLVGGKRLEALSFHSRL